MKRSHAVGASRSFVVRQLSVLNCSTYTADDQVAVNIRSCGIMRLTPFVKGIKSGAQAEEGGC